MKKFVLPLALLTFATVSDFTGSVAHAQSYNRPVRSPVYQYCNENRFDNYIRLASAMRDYVTPIEYNELYIPLKKKAALAKITLKNYGALSARTHAAVYDIVNFVERNEVQFSSLWEVEAFFDIAQDLMDMTTSLSRDLQ